MASGQKGKSPKFTTAAGHGHLPEPSELEPNLGDDRPDSYRVKLEVFEGPLDLLLFLIKKDEIDIYDIPIARITEEYLEYLRLMEQLDIAVAGDFLVMASTLIYIKSKLLLPPDPKIEGAEDLTQDPRAELVERLLEYQKFKAAANMLYSRAEIEAASFTRGEIDSDKNNPEISATLFDLLRVFRETLNRAESALEMEIQRDEVTMAEKLDQINTLLAEREEINVREMFEMAYSRRDLILTFLAFLELVKEMKIILLQSDLFGEIIARRRVEGISLAEPGAGS
jgi:segregation and condensation protein A